MAVITMPASLRIDQCAFGQVRYDHLEVSEGNGNEASRPQGPPRWAMSITSGDYLTPAEAGEWLVMLMQLRGRINHLAAWDPARLQPQGTMRGTLTLNGAHSAGATSISVTGGVGQANTTLLKGDMLQLATGLSTSQVVMVVADATANGSGVITLTVEAPLRIAFSNGAAVAWSKPTVYFKLQNEASRWKYTRAASHRQGGFSADLLEAFG